MLQRYLHRSQSVQPSSESEYESESESESGSGSGSEEEQELVEHGQHVLTQRSDAHGHQLRQCGSAVGGALCGPEPALENYFAHLTKQYYGASALEGRIDPGSSYQKPKQWEEESDYTYNDGQLHYTTNKYIGYAQNDDYGRMVPINPKPATPKKGKEEHGYAYYESNLVNNGRVGHARNNNNDLRYISQEDSTIPPSSRSRPTNKGTRESVYAYDESKFGNNQNVGYSANYLGPSYSIPPSHSKPKLKNGKESRYASDESEFDNNQHVVYGSREYYDMMYNGSKKSSASTSSTTSSKRITYM